MKQTRQLLIVFILLVLVYSCSNKGGKALNIKESVFTAIDGKAKSVDSFYTFDKSNLEIDLKGVYDGSKFEATKQIYQSERADNAINIFLVDENKKDIFFKSSTDFLNYMTDYGYEMIDKKETKYGAQYVFKKGK